MHRLQQKVLNRPCDFIEDPFRRRSRGARCRIWMPENKPSMTCRLAASRDDTNHYRFHDGSNHVSSLARVDVTIVDGKAMRLTAGFPRGAPEAPRGIDLSRLTESAHHRRISPMTNVTRKTMRKIKNNIFAILAAPAAMPPNPNAAAMIATMKKTRA
jgi:hypothetical protein